MLFNHNVSKDGSSLAYSVGSGRSSYPLSVDVETLWLKNTRTMDKVHLLIPATQHHRQSHLRMNVNFCTAQALPFTILHYCFHLCVDIQRNMSVEHSVMQHYQQDIRWNYVNARWQDKLSITQHAVPD
jgi:hypothetical protein